ncbi:hypothetical protein GFL88_31535 [Rhizobium leguminosarum bv. viciae]|nr:hypothetical protein [Rhizobium leguminosarum bv. viciae]
MAAPVHLCCACAADTIVARPALDPLQVARAHRYQSHPQSPTSSKPGESDIPTLQKQDTSTLRLQHLGTYGTPERFWSCRLMLPTAAYEIVNHFGKPRFRRLLYQGCVETFARAWEHGSKYWSFFVLHHCRLKLITSTRSLPWPRLRWNGTSDFLSVVSSCYGAATFAVVYITL